MNKKIGIKNYVQVVLLFVITIVIVLYLSSWYSSYKKDKLSIPVINGVLSEINYEELDPYLKENNGILYLYICTSDENICRNFENEFIKVIEKKDLYEKIIYLNITDVPSKKEFIKEFNNKYADKKKLSTYPVILYFEDGKIKDVIGTGSKGLTIAKLNDYLNKNEIN